jgi:hypothetical protein
MTGRTGAVRVEALFSMEKIDEQGGEEKAEKNAEEKKAPASSTHFKFRF